MILIKHLSSIMFLSRQSLNLIPYVDVYQYIDCTSQDILLDTCNQGNCVVFNVSIVHTTYKVIIQ